MAKTLIVVGSRRDGNSKYLATKIKEKLALKRVVSNIIVPGDQKIYVCTGCMDCDKKGVCDFKDDMIKNIKLIEDADYIIIITPTRWNLLSGDLKIFIDRLNPLYVKGTLKNKKLIAIAIGSSCSDEYSSSKALKSLTNFAESASLNVVLEEYFNNCLKYNDIEKQEEKLNKLLDKIDKLITN